ncbi:pyruvate ferredoxin oxidoreductase [Clostridium estertheticum]|uniref:pyruvate ferredoxin oxidoreductase n=1 Tax=Clostridium estertheticum TaxID=238834 RepID=UPI001C7DBE2F|nr:pyruvate ferredoxin oxidoreductase [Clostridium estertheticum]MBX4264513.1 pyruvate ferredoxin oxidoreductase [Clostridium estertheticum]WLC88660.1 pyruvate ferredoxin oxidoreductase [Clostridium estertheticum]
MAKKVSLSGNEAVAEAMLQIDPDVVAAYPITPSTEVPQYFSQFVNDGKVHTEFIPVESEHSAMSACIGASAAGARVMTATSANGLAFMWEMLNIASSMRLPIIMAVANRAITGPININNDHSDSMGAMNTGWIQIYSESVQEAYDNFVQAVKIAENKDVRLPVMVCYDGFITSHAVENMTILDKEEVQKFVGEYNPEQSLLKGDALTYGALDLPQYLFEHKRLQLQGMINAKKVILEVASEYKNLTGRKYSFFEEYRMENAEVAIVIINSTAGTAKVVVNNLRERGIKAGLIKIRMFRPFPAEEIAKALENVKAAAVLDKVETFSTVGGPLFLEVRSALYGRNDGKLVTSYIYGLGGRDVTIDSIEEVYDDLLRSVKTGKAELYNHLRVRE